MSDGVSAVKAERVDSRSVGVDRVVSAEGGGVVGVGVGWMGGSASAGSRGAGEAGASVEA